MFLEELEDLKNRYPERFALYHVLSREEQEVQLFHGRIDARAHRACSSTSWCRRQDVDEWFLCGPREMIESARAVLLERGVDADHVHAELFHAEDRPRPERPPSSARRRARAGAAEVTIVLDGRSSTFPRRSGRRAHPRRRAACSIRRALRVQGRRLRHLPRQAGQRQCRDGSALRARTARDRRRLRARLPVAPNHRARSSSTSTSDRIARARSDDRGQPARVAIVLTFAGAEVEILELAGHRGPAMPSPMLRLSISMTAETSAPVPQSSTSSAM